MEFGFLFWILATVIEVSGDSS